MAETPTAGQQAPELDIPDQTGKNVKLSDFSGKRLVLYFYPKSFTGGCTKQACSLRDGIEGLRGLNAEVVGVSVDDVDTQARFIAEHNLPFTLLADADGTLTRRYGVERDNGMARRVTFVIDGQGKITHVFDPAQTETHAEEVSAVLG